MEKLWENVEERLENGWEKWGAGRGRFVWLVFHLFSPFCGVFPGLIALFFGFSPRFSFPRADFSTLCGEWGRKYGMDWLLFCWIIRVLGDWGRVGVGCGKMLENVYSQWDNFLDKF